MKSHFSFILVLVATLFVSLPTLIVGESCAAGEGECANPDAPDADGTAVKEDPVEEDPVKEDPNCPSRDLIIRCAGEHLDENKNGKLDRSELQGAIDKLPWYARGILQILGSVDKMVSFFLPGMIQSCWNE